MAAISNMVLSVIMQTWSCSIDMVHTQSKSRAATDNQRLHVSSAEVCSCLQRSSGEHFVDQGCGGKLADDNLDCLLVPLSTTCSIKHVTVNNSAIWPRLIERDFDKGPVRLWFLRVSPSQAST